MTAEEKQVRAYNIREVRELLGFTQEEFSYLVGISAVYLSQIETGNRQLNDDIAQKITDPLNWLTRVTYYTKSNDTEDSKAVERWNNKCPTTDYIVMANHIASFYPIDIQAEIINLYRMKSRINRYLNNVLKMGEIPHDLTHPVDDIANLRNVRDISIYGFFTSPNKDRDSEVKNIIEENVRKVKNFYADNKKRVAHQKSKNFFEDSGEVLKVYRIARKK